MSRLDRLKYSLAQDGWRISATVAFLAALSDLEPSAWTRTGALWAVSCVLLVASASGKTFEDKVLDTSVPDTPAILRSRGFLLCLALCAFSLLPRGIGLSVFPPDVHGDEASLGLEAIALTQATERSLFGFGWAGLPNLGLWLQGLGMEWSGPNLQGLRLGSVLFGVGSLIAQAILLVCLFGTRVALLALLPLLTYHWHVHLSRTGTSYIQATFFVTWSLAFFAWGRQTACLRPFALCGIVTALGCLTYPAARITPLILLAFLCTEFLADPKAHPLRWKQWSWLLGGFLVALIPVLPRLVQNLPIFSMSGPRVFLWFPKNLAHASQALGTDRFLEILWIQTSKTFGIFYFGADTGEQYRFIGRYMDPFLFPFFLLGILICLLRFRHTGHRLFLLSFLLTLILGCILCVDAPFMPHASPIANLPYSFAAIGLGAVLDYPWKVKKQYLGLLVGLLCTASLVWNLQTYFIDYAKQRPAGTWPRLISKMSALPPNTQFRLLTGSRFFWDYDIRRFLLPNASGQDVGSLESELRAVNPGQRVFLLFSQQTQQLEQLRNHFPCGGLLPDDGIKDILFFEARPCPALP